jgi:hypothetical protein
MAMKTNVGTADRWVRIAVGFGIIAIAVLGFVSPWWLGFVGIIPIVTAIGGWCPVYEFLGWESYKTAGR